jgi:hypothetical protein
LIKLIKLCIPLQQSFDGAESECLPQLESAQSPMCTQIEQLAHTGTETGASDRSTTEPCETRELSQSLGNSSTDKGGQILTRPEENLGAPHLRTLLEYVDPAHSHWSKEHVEHYMAYMKKHGARAVNHRSFQMHDPSQLGLLEDEGPVHPQGGAATAREAPPAKEGVKVRSMHDVLKPQRGRLARAGLYPSEDGTWEASEETESSIGSAGGSEERVTLLAGRQAVGGEKEAIHEAETLLAAGGKKGSVQEAGTRLAGGVKTDSVREAGTHLGGGVKTDSVREAGTLFSEANNKAVHERGSDAQAASLDVAIQAARRRLLPRPHEFQSPVLFPDSLLAPVVAAHRARNRHFSANGSEPFSNPSAVYPEPGANTLRSLVIAETVNDLGPSHLKVAVPALDVDLFVYRVIPVKVKDEWVLR